MNRAINLRTNKLLAAANSASGAVVWARPVDRSNPNGNWSAMKYYKSDVDPDTVDPSQASDAVTELFMYRYTNNFLHDGVTPHVCYMNESLRHPNAEMNVAEPDVLVEIEKKSGRAAKAIRSGAKYTILPTYYKKGAISLDEALFPKNGKAFLSELELSWIVFQVLYTIECMARVGILHLDIHLGNVMLYPEPKDMKQVRAYEYVDRNLQRHVFYIPMYGWIPKIYDFDHAVKHSFPGRTVEYLGRLKEHYDGSVANTFLMDVGLSYIFAPFVKKMDTFVDAHKFLLHLLTCSLLRVQTPRGPVVRKDPYEWGKDPSAFSPVRKWTGARRQLEAWTSFDRFKQCATQEFDLRASAGSVDRATAARNPMFRAQATQKYPYCFHYNYSIQMKPQPDPVAINDGNLLPVAEYIDLAREGVASADAALVDYAKKNMGNVLNYNQNATVVETYSILRLFDEVAPTSESPGQVCPQPNLVGPPLQLNTAVSADIVDPMEVDENPEVQQLNPFAGPRNEAINMNVDASILDF
jgi:serine/threonine protein kinase